MTRSSGLLSFGIMSDFSDAGRRRFLKILLAVPLAFAVGMRLLRPSPLAAAGAPGPAAWSPPPKAGFVPTPECGDGDEPTPAETEGPFYKPRSPLRTSLLEPGVDGTRILLAGRVFSRECRPLPGVLLDFWHADRDGEY